MTISLEASIRTCSIDDGWAAKIQSDRFQNPNLMMCPMWNGVDTAGRQVHPDSFVTKRAGCNSALDRVVVENDLRPQYAEYITLNAAGIQGNFNDAEFPYNEAKLRNVKLAAVNGITGNFGTDFGSVTDPRCGNNPYVDAQRAEAAAARKLTGARNLSRANRRTRRS
ncbi:MAG: hypothetical protein JKX76_02300 [Colwellia sp.]|nr:hypothetical protein [Colwellia sp.]